mgnify:CR=1 FL=1
MYKRQAETQLETGIAVTGEITDDEPEVAEVDTVEAEAAEAEASEDDDSAK